MNHSVRPHKKSFLWPCKSHPLESLKIEIENKEGKWIIEHFTKSHTQCVHICCLNISVLLSFTTQLWFLLCLLLSMCFLFCQTWMVVPCSLGSLIVWIFRSTDQSSNTSAFGSSRTQALACTDSLKHMGLPQGRRCHLGQDHSNYLTRLHVEWTLWQRSPAHWLTRCWCQSHLLHISDSLLLRLLMYSANSP